MPAYYPVFLDVRDRRCVVIGGDETSEQKVLTLLEYGAEAVLITPQAGERLRELAGDGRLTWVRRRYRRGDLDGAFIAIVADAGDQRVNRAVHEEATLRNIPLNVVDVTHLCTWIAPAVVRRGEVTVAISTGGASPALARKFREELSGVSPVSSRHGVMEYADLAPLLSDARGELARRGIRVAPDHWQVCLTDDLVDLVHEGKTDQARGLLMSCLLKSTERDREDSVGGKSIDTAPRNAADGERDSTSAD